MIFTEAEQEELYHQRASSIRGRATCNAYRLHSHHSGKPGLLCQGNECSDGRDGGNFEPDSDDEPSSDSTTSTCVDPTAGAGAFGDYGNSSEGFNISDFSAFDNEQLDAFDFDTYLHDDSNNTFLEPGLTFNEGLETSGME